MEGAGAAPTQGDFVVAGELHTLRSCIAALYGTASSLHNEASNWLEAFRRRKDGLSFAVCLALLSEAAPCSAEEQFATQTLVVLSRKSWHAGGMPAMYIETMGRLAGTYFDCSQARAQTQICLACAAAAIACPSIEAPALFPSLMRLAISPTTGQPHPHLQVALLTALAEEAESMAVSLPPDRRVAVLMHLRDPSPSGPPQQVLQFLLEGAHGVPASSRVSALDAWLRLQCLPWLKLAPCLSAIARLAYQACGQVDGMVVAMEFLSTLLSTHAMAECARLAVTVISQLLTDRRDLLVAAEGQPLVCMLVEVGNACLDTVPPPNPLTEDPSAIINPLLTCLAQAPLDTAMVASDFWTGCAACPPPLTVLAEQASVSLFHTLLARCCYPPSHVSSTLAERDALGEFREEARDLYRAVASHRGPSFATALLEETLGKTQAIVQQHQSNASSLMGEWWVELESLLHALSSLSRLLLAASRPAPSVDQGMHRLLDSMASLPLHPGLLCTSVMLISVCQHWLSCHPESLSPCIMMVLASLSFSEDADVEPYPMRARQDHAGAVALVKLSHEAARQLATVQGIIQSLLHACHQACRCVNGPLTERSRDLVIEAVARIAAQGDGQEVEQLCCLLWGGPATDGVAEGQGGGTAPTVKTLLALQVVGRGTAARGRVFAEACLRRQDALRQGFVDIRLDVRVESVRLLVVLLRSLRNQAAGDAQSMEVLRRCLASWGPALLDAHQSRPLACTMSVVEHAYVTEDEATLQWVRPLLHQLLSITHAALLPSEPNLVQAYFTAVSRLVQPDRPVQVIDTLLDEVVPQSLRAAIRCLATKEQDPGRAVLGFVRQVLDLHSRPGLAACHLKVEHVVGALGESLVMAMLGGICGSMPSNVLDELIQTLVKMCQTVGVDVMKGWLEATIRSPLFPRSHVSDKAKQEFISQWERSARRGDVKSLKTCVKVFCGGKRKGLTQHGTSVVAPWAPP